MRTWSRADRRSIAAMATVIVALHVFGIGVLVGAQYFDLGGGASVLTFGVGILAYTLGMRHAFDVDHIAAVDNTTRKLSQERSGEARPLSVGFWFSLGHSTIVFALTLLLALGVKSLAAPLKDDSSTLHTITGLIGPSVSGLFLWMLGLVNLAALIGIVRVLRRLRAGEFDEHQLEAELEKRGFLYRLIGGLTKRVRKPTHIYPVGVLFGLGFDTATEIGLLVLAGGAAAMDLPFWAIMALPVLFAAGMCLFDTIDGVLMAGAYDWAFTSPARKIFYNLTVTGLSVVVALVIGTIELAGVVAEQLQLDHGPVAAVGSVPLAGVGYGVVVLFVVTWAVAVVTWRVGDVERRWQPAPATSDVSV